MVTDQYTPPQEVAATRAELLANLIGQLIHVARLQLRRSEKEVAERANTSRNTLRKAERGDPAVSLGTVLRLCSTLGVALPSAFNERDLREELRIVRLRREALPTRIRETKKAEPFDAF